MTAAYIADRGQRGSLPQKVCAHPRFGCSSLDLLFLTCRMTGVAETPNEFAFRSGTNREEADQNCPIKPKKPEISIDFFQR